MIRIPVFLIMFFTATSPSFEQIINSFYLYFHKETYHKKFPFRISFIFLTDTFIFYHDLLAPYIKLFAQKSELSIE
ncbi:hypothetical protein FSF04_09635 [Listeria monocytogenes]|nr:hypothetical protein [Listeria monocytogenes]ECJ9744204.1 hypothetical protein [Listeria monocytogenes]ECL1968655.1 hypothetical protein [Listeria monocytogenes]ECP9696704.1 hypothetical protein [Listeria monocytogenes]ECQ0707690.1 hypothetical protein [Listeria monocytogenes]